MVYPKQFKRKRKSSRVRRPLRLSGISSLRKRRLNYLTKLAKANKKRYGILKIKSPFGTYSDNLMKKIKLRNRRKR
jgi:hypothetical protein